jgi:hypothetical protein
VNIFKVWMRAATPGEQGVLADALGTSREYLYQLSGGFRKASPERGAAVEAASAWMHEQSAGRLPKIFRTDMVDACRKCEFARRCLGPDAVRAEFEEVVSASIAPTSDDTEGGTHD